MHDRPFFVPYGVLKSLNHEGEGLQGEGIDMAFESNNPPRYTPTAICSLPNEQRC